jgi:uncharacterized membrane protein YsdA (DUF1294 family)
MGFTTGIKIVLGYLCLMNVIAFFLFRADKRKAKNHAWRIPEKVLVLSAWIGGGIGAWIGMHLFHHKTRKWKFRVLIPLAVVFHLILGFLVYTGQYYHASQAALTAMQSDNRVKVRQIDGGYQFDGAGTDTALIFYPGAKVDERAYAPLLHALAADGTDCFLIRTPFHLPILKVNAADSIQKQIRSHYRRIYVAGHSMGGAVAGMYAAKHLDELDGVIFLAAYPTKMLKHPDFHALSVVGTKDGGYDPEKWNDTDKYMPDAYTFHLIQGGNHSQFGSYGHQTGDGQADISPQQQIQETIEVMKAFLKSR